MERVPQSEHVQPASVGFRQICFCLGAILGALCFMLLGAGIAYKMIPRMGEPIIRAIPAADPRSSALACGAPGSTEWQALSTIDHGVADAVKNGLALVRSERAHCEGGSLPDLIFSAETFEQGQAHNHYVHCHHKYASTCDGETFKLHYYVVAPDTTTEAEKDISSFVVEVFHDFSTDLWSFLRSQPLPCAIASGEVAYPEEMPPTTKFAVEKSEFVVNELAFKMREAGCLGHNKSLEVTRIENVRAEVEAGLRIDMILFLREQASAKDPVKVRLVVLEECDLVRSDRCVNVLELPDIYRDVCSVLSVETSHELRRLLAPFGRPAHGHLEPDATEQLVASRSLLSASPPGVRLPLQQRFISRGEVSAEHDLRDHECFKSIPVYDQGSCASCYAQAIAQMIGIRLCLRDRAAAARKLLDLPVTDAFLGLTATAEEERPIPASAVNESNTTAPAPEPVVSGSQSSSDSACVDDPAWFAPKPENNCQWFKVNDDGCTKYRDYGQRTNCRQTCGLCPGGANADPETRALLQYMPSVNDMAQCAKLQGQIRGCDGGNTQTVWDNNLRSSTRPIHLMGSKCMPYTLKCWKAKGVVNPLSDGQCSTYEQYQLWNKPCLCIGKTLYPKSYTCPAESPASSCAFPIPPVAFTLAHMAHGLSNQDTVLNIQRHIVEPRVGGPIYAAFATTSSFMRWDWATKPVYTGGGTVIGGHAVNIVGWGSRNGVPYWLIRNSWGSRWAEAGYCKFERGRNLDRIESFELSAVMPAADIPDFTNPSCVAKSWTTLWSTQGNILYAYTMKLLMQCSREATVKLTTSNRIAGGPSKEYTVEAAPAQKVFSQEIDLGCSGFGTEAGDIVVGIQGTARANGNVGYARHTLAIRPVAGVTTFAGTC